MPRLRMSGVQLDKLYSDQLVRMIEPERMTVRKSPDVPTFQQAY
jgi:hypothetical protein